MSIEQSIIEVKKENPKWGARLIAQKLGLEHHGSVSRILRKNFLPAKSFDGVINEGEIYFTKEKSALPKAAEEYLKYLCAISNYRYAQISGEIFDLLVDFGGRV